WTSTSQGWRATRCSRRCTRRPSNPSTGTSCEAHLLTLGPD
ncbi:MAG: hypothetical protein AVDCRST_MAG76-2794, partial [uncultured Acidimicrobiales bacterium]